MADEMSGVTDPSQNQLQNLTMQRKRTKWWFFVWISLFGSMFTGYLAILAFFNTAKSGTESAVILPYLVFFLIAVFMQKSRLRELDNEIRETRFENELSANPIEPREVRAERLFRMNQYELRKYYDLNRNQNRIIVIIGISCILLGLGVVIFTLYLVNDGFQSARNGADVNGLEVWAKSIVAVVGAVGTILVNYVAAIFLKMHSAASTALGEFHARLVETHKLFLANVLASRIDDDAKRQDILGALAKAMTIDEQATTTQ